MTYLDRIEVVGRASSVGFVGERTTPNREQSAEPDPSVGSVGEAGGRVWAHEGEQAGQHPPHILELLKSKLKTEVFRQKKPPSGSGPISKMRPPHEPTKPTKAFLAADLRNSSALFTPQADSNRCHVCGERESMDEPFLAVLSAKPEHPHWLHVACHAEHARRIDARVEAALQAAAPITLRKADSDRLSLRAGKPGTRRDECF